MSDVKFKAKFNIFKFNKFTLYGKKWKGGDKAPSLALGIYQNNPRFVLYLNNGSYDKGITMALDPIIFTEIMNEIIDVSTDREMKPHRATWDLKNKYDHRRKYDQLTVVGQIHVGRDSEGLVFLAVKANGEDMCKFEFTPSWFAPQKDSTGETTAANISSGSRARAWAEHLKGLLMAYLAAHGEEPVRRDEQRRPQQQSRSSNYGGSSDFDDDVSF